jgi:CRISPR-associated endonuclease/helicase Cas3
LQKYLPRIARHRGFRKRSKDAHYRWQDKAFDLAAAIQNRSSQQGFFGVNMASTGCGKTLANGRIMYALADQKLGVRFNIAIGLRTLTLQTGDAYRDRLGLGAEDLAVLVGGGSVRALHEFNNNMTSGSESERMLQPENQYVHFEGSLSDGPLNRWIQRSPDAQKLLNAPILVCTIDHLIPATESTRGGHQIAPMLRLLTSDLVLDEPDDFGIEDLPALARLVNWAGMLGCRVLLSSATLPPALIKGLFQAYLKGRYEYQRNRGIPGAPLNVCCAWFDEFGTASGDYATIASYELEHRAFVAKRLKKLASTETRRRAEIVPLPIARGQDRKTLYSDFAGYLYQYLHNLHAIHHNVDPLTDKRVSFGLIRMANIDPLVATTQALCALGAASDHHIYLCAYHSQHPLIVRSEIERHLDIVLNRTVSQNVFQEPIIRSLLDKNAEQNHIFIVIATAVAEVGRDHDYDWGIVEPSSMRSIIQLAGRIRRHRYGNCDAPNLYLLDTNLRHLRKGSKAPSFCRPGFETALFPLDSHHLNDLLTTEQVVSIDASSRISEPQNLDPRQNLVALEHERIKALMLGEQGGGQLKTIPVEWWWRTPASLSGELQRKQPFRHDPLGRQRYGLIPDDDNIPKFSRFEHDGTLTRVHDNLLHPMSIDRGSRLSFWGVPDYLNTLTGMADALEMDLDMCAHRFGVIDLPAKGVDQGWYYHPKLGFSRYQ